MKLKRIQSGRYITEDGKYTIEKDGCFWYAYDTQTGQSVVDCENTMSHIKESLEGFIKRSR